jgi:hypothetical protein
MCMELMYVKGFVVAQVRVNVRLCEANWGWKKRIDFMMRYQHPKGNEPQSVVFLMISGPRNATSRLRQPIFQFHYVSLFQHII